MTQRFSVYFFLVAFLLGCSFSDLPEKKTLRSCQKPAAGILYSSDPANYLRYTFSLGNSSGDIETVEWSTGSTVVSQRSNESFIATFSQPGSYTVKATLKNGCNNNTVLEQQLTVSALVPSVSTVRVESVSQNSAVVVMNVTGVGSGSLTETGIVYAEAPITVPTRQNLFEAGSMALNTDQRVTLFNLKPATTYYARAYAKNSLGQSSLGSTILQFTTSQNVPSISTWSQTFGGSNAEYAYHVLPNGNGFLVIGNSASSNGNVGGNRGSYDAWVAQVDYNGNLIWQRTIGGSGDDILRQGRTTPDGNFILVGNTSSNNGDVFGNNGGYDAWLVKLSPSGTILWQRTYGTADNEFGFCVENTSEGGFILAGRSTVSGKSGGYLWNINSSGSVLNSALYSSQLFDDIISPTTGQYLIAGSQLQTGTTPDAYVGRFSSASQPTSFNWARTFGGRDEDGVTCILHLVGDGPLLSGFINTETGTSNIWNADVLVAKLNAAGSLSWQKNFGGSGNDNGQAAIQTADGGFLIIGSTESNDRDVSGNKGGADVWVLKLNNAGGIQWQKTYGGPGNDFGTSMIQAPDGGYIIVGYTSSTSGDISFNRGNNDFLILKLDSEGNLRR